MCFSLFYLKKCNIRNNKIILFFIGPLQQFSLELSVFQVHQ